MGADCSHLNCQKAPRERERAEALSRFHRGRRHAELFLLCTGRSVCGGGVSPSPATCQTVFDKLKWEPFAIGIKALI